jgi:hypothetical protein
MDNLKIEYLPVSSLKMYEKNARKHEKEDVQAIVESIKEFGFDDPIGIWGEENTIVEGHGRLMAAQMLGMDEVPCIRLDHLDDEQRRAYALAHNKTAELSVWDSSLLPAELDEIFNIDMSKFGFGDITEGGSEDNPYTTKVKIPQYQPTGEFVSVRDLMDSSKTEALIEEIEGAEGLEKEEKDFLIEAAKRHIVFDYRKIAEYYAVASPKMQELMERSALVIIDYEDAIANGYVRLTERLEALRDA